MSVINMKIEKNKNEIYSTMERVIDRGDTLEDIMKNCNEMSEFIPIKVNQRKKSVKNEDTPLLQQNNSNQNEKKKCCICFWKKKKKKLFLSYK